MAMRSGGGRWSSQRPSMKPASRSRCPRPSRHFRPLCPLVPFRGRDRRVYRAGSCPRNGTCRSLRSGTGCGARGACPREQARSHTRCTMWMLRSALRLAATASWAAPFGLAAANAQTADHVRQDDRRQRLPHSELRRDGSGLLQGGRPRRPLRFVDRQGAGHRRTVRQRRLRADPLRRRAGGIERARRSATSSANRSSRSGSSSCARRSASPRTSRARPSATAAPVRPTTTKARRCSTASSIWTPARTTRSSRSRARPSGWRP